jgi:4-amino-4-deoxy-L-arabinose transferase-like glycosyltransferase
VRGLALLVFGLLWLAALGRRSLLSPDEGRYATLALNMLHSGDWVTPRLNGLLYFEKPPLQYWAGTLSFITFGVNEFAARLWPGLAGIATVFLVGHTARRLWGEAAGWHALLIAGSTTWIVGNSHFLALDAGLTGALTLVLCGMLIAQSGEATPAVRRRWMIAAWVGVGLAVLAKGLVGLLIPGAVLVLTSLWRRDLSMWRRLAWWPGLPLMLAITVPWFVLVSMRNPGFAQFFFIHEHFERFLTTEHRRVGAWYYFVPVLIGGFMPWTSTLPWLMRAPRADFARCWLVIWAGFIFFFFSVSGSKLQSYILPMFPALALLLARTVGSMSPRVLRIHLVLPALGWCALLAVATQYERLVRPDTPLAAVESLGWGIGCAALVGLAGIAAAWWLLKQSRRDAALATVAATHVVALLLAFESHDAYGQLKSGERIAQAMAPYVDAATPVYSVRAYEQTLPFYLRRNIVLVDYTDEFAFGETHEPERWIPTLDAFAERWRQAPRAAAYTTRDTLTVLREQQGLQMRVIYEDPRRLVVVKP